MLFNLKSKTNINLIQDHKEELTIKHSSNSQYYVTEDNIETVEGNTPKEILKLSMEIIGMLLGFIDLKKYKI